VGYSYSDSGNLLSKSDFGTTYNYAAINGHANGCGPHAPYSVALAPSGTATYNCDANGNVYGGALTATFDADNHPRSVTKAGGNETWAYDAHGARDYESTAAGTRYFGPGGYEKTSSSQIHELGPIVVTMTGSNTLITTTLRDRLGSTIDAIDGGIPNSASGRVYDAFGAVRNGDMSPRSGGTLNEPDTIHGFTQHEHADAVQLIHMGGRIYDYALGRFLSVDPVIGNPLHSQSLNPYSYIGNNPLSGTDPTGYASCDAGKTLGSGCLEMGENTITKDGKAIGTIILGNAHENIAITGHMDVNKFVEKSGGRMNIAYNPSNGADSWEPRGSKKSADGIGSVPDTAKGCGNIACYDAHRNKGEITSFERTFVSDSKYNAINGITNELGRALQLMSDHVYTRFNGQSDFMLVHAPTYGFWHDLFDVWRNKEGFTTDTAKGVTDLLAANDHQMNWVVHSGGGQVFAEAARLAVNGGASLSNTTVAFDSAANNQGSTNTILSRGGAHLFQAGRFNGYFDRKNDAVPMIAGGRG